MNKTTIFLSDLDGGGAERVMLNLAQGFINKGLDVDLVLVRKIGPYLEQIPPQVRVVDLQGVSLLRSIPALSNYLKKERPQILFSALEDTNIVAILAKLLARVPTPLVVTVHNNLSQESCHAPNLKRKLVPYLVPWFYPFADGVVSVSNGVAEDLAKLGLAKEKIRVIHNPIVTPQLSYKLQQKVEHPWLQLGQPPVILGVGRLTKQKDFPTLIAAFAKVRQQIPVKLMLLGEGEERSYLEALVQKLGVAEDVSLPGFVANPYAYMAKARVLVLSSAWEGFGNVLVEAMAAGTPVISTNCPSGPAEILAQGDYGKLVAVGDSEGMAVAIAKTLQEEPNSQLLQQRAVDFSLEKVVSQYQQLISVG